MVEPIYPPRKPKLSPLYQSIVSHFSGFESVYEERYQRRYGVLRDVVREVLYKYLGCGDLRKGFARIKCKGCNHEALKGVRNLFSNSKRNWRTYDTALSTDDRLAVKLGGNASQDSSDLNPH